MVRWIVEPLQVEIAPARSVSEKGRSSRICHRPLDIQANSFHVGATY